MAELKLKADSGGGTSSLKGPASSGATPSWRLPSADGSAGQVLITDGSGTLSFDYPNRPACQVYMSSNMTSLGNDTLTKLEFDTEDFDTDSAYDTTNKKFTVPAGKGGKYLINACAYVAAGVDMYTQLHIYKNGSSIAYNYNHGSASAGGSLSNNITRIITLAATDYIEFYVSTNATTRTVYTSNNIARTTASILRLIV